MVEWEEGVNSLQNCLLHKQYHGIHKPLSCVDVHAAVLLQSVLMSQMTFAVQAEPMVTLEMSPIYHQYYLIFPQHNFVFPSCLELNLLLQIF
jgi:hypothetical protein